MPEVGDILELEVGPVAHGGFCVARFDGQAVFVRHSLPGETVRASVTEVRPRYLRADAVEVLTASEHRVEAPCEYAHPGGCGGCDWQHARLPYQRELKAAVVHEQLLRLAGLDLDVTVDAVPGSDDGLGWRTRVGFAVRRDGTVGLHKARSHAIQPVDRCLIAHPGVEELGVEARTWPYIRAVEAVASATTSDRLVAATPVSRRQPLHPIALNVPAGFVRDDDKGHMTTLRGPGAVTENAAGRSWRVTGGGFWQIHPAAAQTLVDAVMAQLAPAPGESALDLFCGVGLFAGALAEAVGATGQVVAVEGDRQAVLDAEHNLADLPQVRVSRGRIGTDPTNRWLGGRATVDMVVLDPPRTGAGPALCREIVGLAPRAICYVACDPAALARDTAALAEVGYTLRELRAYDLFPMTSHVECVALFLPV
ncbi:class I SAM-dependent RNA methyltransferase [Acidothermaceae bacterium B102]|nr:class I SAM-dependent RNA methyltransferase [Acidothermaceae bacterium B102]